MAGAGKIITDSWPVVGDVKDPFTKDKTNEFVRAYSVAGATTGAFHWFGAFPQDAEDNRKFTQHKLPMPLLAMGGEFHSAAFLADHCRLVANNVKEAKISGAGHWLVQEQTDQVQKQLLNFFLGK